MFYKISSSIHNEKHSDNTRLINSKRLIFVFYIFCGSIYIIHRTYASNITFKITLLF